MTSGSAEPHRGDGLWSWVDWYLILGGVSILFCAPQVATADGEVRLATLHSLASGHIPHEKYSLVLPLLALPLHAIDTLFGSGDEVALRFNALVFALGLAAFVAILRPRLPSHVLRAFILIILYSSLFSGAVTSFYGETLTAILVGVGTLGVVSFSSRAGRCSAWAAVILGVVNTPAFIPAFAALTVVYSVRSRRWWALALVPLALSLSILDTRLHTGGLTNNPYGGDHGFRTVMPYSGLPGFSYPAFFGVLLILGSFGKGLVFFTPGLFLPARRRLASWSSSASRAMLLWIVVIAALIAVYSRWWAWYGGGSWGPRFFVFASIPASLALAARLHQGGSLGARSLTLVALALSTWVGILGFADHRIATICIEHEYALESLCWTTPEFSVLWHPLVGWSPSWPRLDWTETTFALLGIASFLRLAVPFLAETVPVARRALGQGLERAAEDRW